MKTFLSKSFFRKYGKRALIIYLCWCLVKGFLLIILGFKMLT
jgi:hypothetical protein